MQAVGEVSLPETTRTYQNPCFSTAPCLWAPPSAYRHLGGAEALGPEQGAAVVAGAKVMMAPLLLVTCVDSSGVNTWPLPRRNTGLL